MLLCVCVWGGVHTHNSSPCEGMAFVLFNKKEGVEDIS